MARLDVDSALLSLSLSDRAVLLLRYQEGHDYRTIAEVTGHPPGTIASRLHRARERLGALLNSAYGRMEEAGCAGHLNHGQKGDADSTDLGIGEDVADR
jgi:DNA-directed RNA polymerase specialized sigma24 family protein